MSKSSNSKFLSLILRHKPDVIGIELDRHGWANIKDIVRNWSRNAISNEEIFEIVHSDNKNRYELSGDLLQIRARQGHSLKNVDVELEKAIPLDILYHGTVDRFVEPIKVSGGLIKGSRQYVHLSGDIDTAKTVGGRRGSPVILTIDSKQMAEDGIVFYLSSNGVWLTDFVDKKYFIEYSWTP
jgi:putative RNA 2'-phosphotransferase